MPQKRRPATSAPSAVEHHGVGIVRHRLLGAAGVVVAPHEHVRHVEGADLAHQRGLGVGAPVGDVAGVGHRVHRELVDQQAHQVERPRVEVDVAHVQHPDRPAGSKVGSCSPARYRVATLSTRSPSWARYSPKRSSTASTSPTAAGARVSRPL